MKLNGSRVSTVCRKPVTSGHVTKLIFFVFFTPRSLCVQLNILFVSLLSGKIFKLSRVLWKFCFTSLTYPHNIQPEWYVHRYSYHRDENQVDAPGESNQKTRIRTVMEEEK